MLTDDFLYGCHSGIQKAIRRCNLDLTKTCFDAMWADKKHRSWMQWRVLAIVQEDVFPLVGELPEFFGRVRALDKESPEFEEEWRKMYYRITVAPKQKDAASLLFAGKASKPEGATHPEMKSWKHWHNLMQKEGGTPDKVAEPLYEAIVKDERFGPRTAYEIAALGMLRKRTGMGGMLGDRQCSLVAMLLIAHRGLDQAEVLRGEKRGIATHLQVYGRRKPRTVNLPWYSFDMHTVAGKMAMSAYGKRNKHGLEHGDIGSMWFMLESNFTPMNRISYGKIMDEPGPWDCIWHAPLLKLKLSIQGMSPKETKALWETSCREEVRDLVVWALEKRGDKPVAAKSKKKDPQRKLPGFE